jgi:hypothetical protein
MMTSNGQWFMDNPRDQEKRDKLKKEAQEDLRSFLASQNKSNGRIQKQQQPQQSYQQPQQQVINKEVVPSKQSLPPILNGNSNRNIPMPVLQREELSQNFDKRYHEVQPFNGPPQSYPDRNVMYGTGYPEMPTFYPTYPNYFSQAYYPHPSMMNPDFQQHQGKYLYSETRISHETH